MDTQKQIQEMDTLLRNFCKNKNLDYNKVDKELLLKNIIVQYGDTKARQAYINITKDIFKKKHTFTSKGELKAEIGLLEFEGEILEAQMQILKDLEAK